MPEELEVDIANLKHAYEKLYEVMNDIEDVDGMQEQYEILEHIQDEICGKRVELEIELEELQDEEYFEENKEQWQKEIAQQNRDYERSK